MMILHHILIALTIPYCKIFLFKQNNSNEFLFFSSSISFFNKGSVTVSINLDNLMIPFSYDSFILELILYCLISPNPLNFIRFSKFSKEQRLIEDSLLIQFI